MPLCRGHHRQLHQAGNEEAWWTARKIAALAIAKDLWPKRVSKVCTLCVANFCSCCDITAEAAECLAQRTLNDINARYCAVALGDTATTPAIHADGIHLVEISQCVVFYG